MLKSIEDSPEAIFIKNSPIKRTFEHFLDDIPAIDREINQQIKKYDDAQIKSIIKADEIRCKGITKVYKKTLKPNRNNI